MSAREWPDHICPEAPVDARLAKPMLIDGSYVVTNGHILIAWDDADREAGEPDVPLTNVPAILGPDTGEPLTFDADALRAWCEPTDADRCEICVDGRIPCECSECGHEHDYECSTCGGTGFGTLHASFQDVPFDKRLLARMLRGAPGDSVTIARQEGRTLPLILTGDGWRAALAALRHKSDVDYDPLDSLALEKAS